MFLHQKKLPHCLSDSQKSTLHLCCNLINKEFSDSLNIGANVFKFLHYEWYILVQYLTIHFFYSRLGQQWIENCRRKQSSRSWYGSRIRNGLLSYCDGSGKLNDWFDKIITCWLFVYKYRYYSQLKKWNATVPE
jgi:hypothetical protein